jgi:hypothetical protein
MPYPKVLDDFFSKFSQLFQLSFGFALGLAFAQSNISVGWLIAWIFIYEFLFYCFTVGTKYYDLLFRVSYNCLFIIAVFWGQYIYYGKTTFQDFFYPGLQENQRNGSLNKGFMMEKLNNLFNTPLEEEEKYYKRKKLGKKYRNALFK